MIHLLAALILSANAGLVCKQVSAKKTVCDAAPGQLDGCIGFCKKKGGMLSMTADRCFCGKDLFGPQWIQDYTTGRVYYDYAVKFGPPQEIGERS